MFESFFPRPKLLLISLVAYVAVIVLFWMTIGDSVATAIGFNLPADDAEKVIGLGFFVTQDFLWFYLVYFVATISFWWFWRRPTTHPTYINPSCPFNMTVITIDTTGQKFRSNCCNNTIMKV